MAPNQPWHAFYSSVPESIDYPEITMYEAVLRTARRVPEKIAWDFISLISKCANALSSLGLKKGETITISMPTTPVGKVAFKTLEDEDMKTRRQNGEYTGEENNE